MTPLKDRKKMMDQIRRGFLQKFKGRPESEEAPFNWAVYALTYLTRKGFDAKLGIGTFKWPKIPGIMGPGDQPAFAREWSQIQMTAKGVRPEWHCWVVMPDIREIVDMTTCYIPDKFRIEFDREYPYKRPPVSLWAHADEIMHGRWKGVIYCPKAAAAEHVTEFVGRLAQLS